MPKGIPVATFAIGEAGAANAGPLRGEPARGRRRGPRAQARRVPREAARAGRGDATARRPVIAARAPTLGPARAAASSGRMFTVAARTLGYRVTVLDPDPLSPAAEFATGHLNTAVHRSRRRSTSSRAPAPRSPPSSRTRPPRRSTRIARAHRRAPERRLGGDRAGPAAREGLLRRARLPAGRRGRRSTRAADFDAALARVKLPALLKTARFGYDGKGQARIDSRADLAARVRRVEGRAVRARGAAARSSARSRSSSRAATTARGRGLPGRREPPRARHPRRDHRAGAHPRGAGRARPRRSPTRLARELDYVGVLAVEMFVVGGRLLLNEIAPRPHNSGHYTIDACRTSQFEQQVRVLCGLPLGDPSQHTPAVMVNLLGDIWRGGEPDWDAVLRARRRAPAPLRQARGAARAQDGPRDRVRGHARARARGGAWRSARDLGIGESARTVARARPSGNIPRRSPHDRSSACASPSPLAAAPPSPTLPARGRRRTRDPRRRRVHRRRPLRAGRRRTSTQGEHRGARARRRRRACCADIETVVEGGTPQDPRCKPASASLTEPREHRTRSPRAREPSPGGIERARRSRARATSSTRRLDHRRSRSAVAIAGSGDVQRAAARSTGARHARRRIAGSGDIKRGEARERSA